MRVRHFCATIKTNKTKQTRTENCFFAAEIVESYESMIKTVQTSRCELAKSDDVSKSDSDDLTTNQTIKPIEIEDYDDDDDDDDVEYLPPDESANGNNSTKSVPLKIGQNSLKISFFYPKHKKLYSRTNRYRFRNGV